MKSMTKISASEFLISAGCFFSVVSAICLNRDEPCSVWCGLVALQTDLTTLDDFVACVALKVQHIVPSGPIYAPAKIMICFQTYWSLQSR